MPPLHPRYRADVDGLRALGVTSVVGFHAFPGAIPGGFIGVDIFFVISGYLISTILFSNLEKGSFSLLDFYRRRIRRIFPALIIVIIVSLGIGWWVLMANEYGQLGKHVAAGSVFLSNLALYRESGYFDDAAGTKPMLHLWSLAVEEQFYIFWPLMLVIVWRRRLGFLQLTAVVAALSFADNIYLANTNPAAAFYSPISRFWELMVGGILAYVTLHRRDLINKFPNAQSVFGLVLVSLGFAFVTEQVAFPGWWALLPTLGTALVISAGPAALLNRVLFSNRIAVWLGLISYPLYLWHWPLISLARIVIPKTPIDVIVFVVVASVLLAWLTYRLVELPIRHSVATTAVPVGLTAAMACLFLFGLSLYAKQGFPDRAVVEANRDPNSGFDGGLSGVEVDWSCDRWAVDALRRKAWCARDSRAPVRYAIIGDSKAKALFPGLVRSSTDAGRWELIAGSARDGAPIPVLSDDEIYKRHKELATVALRSLIESKEIDVVVFAVATRTLFNLGTDYDINGLPSSPYFKVAYDGMLRAADEVIESGKKVVLVVDNPTLPYPQHCWERRTGSSVVDHVLRLDERNKPCRLELNEYYRLSRQYRKLLIDLQRTNPEKILLFDTIPYLCDSKRNECLTFVGDRPLYGKTDHLSDYAAGIVGKALNEFLSNLGTDRGSRK